MTATPDSHSTSNFQSTLLPMRGLSSPLSPGHCNEKGAVKSGHFPVSHVELSNQRQNALAASLLEQRLVMDAQHRGHNWQGRQPQRDLDNQRCSNQAQR